MGRANVKTTAEGVAVLRAAGARDPSVRNPDVLAGRLISWRFRMLNHPPLRPLAVRAFERRSPGMYLYHQARTKHLDRIFQSAVTDVDQVVLLGAGLDTRAYRFSEQLEGKKVFEVDHPATSAWKRERLRRVGTRTDHVMYVVVDFNVERFDDPLKEAGWEPGATTFFHWEGVSMYLPRGSIEGTLEAIATSASGSEVAFDFVHQSAIDRPDDHLGASAYQQTVDRRGEPVLFGLEAEEVVPFLDRFSLSVVSIAEPGDLLRYFPGRPLCDFFSIVHARRI